MISTEATYQDCVYSRLADDYYWKCRMHERWIGTTSLLLACRRLHNRWNASNWKNFDGREEFHQSSPNASDLIPWGWRNETILKRTFNHRSILCPFGSVLSPNVSTTPITAMWCRQCLPLSVVQLKGKDCRKPHCHKGTSIKDVQFWGR